MGRRERLGWPTSGCLLRRLARPLLGSPVPLEENNGGGASSASFSHLAQDGEEAAARPEPRGSRFPRRPPAPFIQGQQRPPPAALLTPERVAIASLAGRLSPLGLVVTRETRSLEPASSVHAPALPGSPGKKRKETLREETGAREKR